MTKKLLQYCKNNKKNLILAIIITALLIVFCYSAINHNMTLNKTAFSYESNDSTVGGIWDTTEILQTFVSTKSFLSGFSIRFGTFARENNGTVTVELLSDPFDKDSAIFSETIEAKVLRDTAFKNFEFSPVKNALGKEFAIRITASEVGDKPVTAWCTDGTNAYKDGTLYINGSSNESDLNMQIFYCGQFEFEDFLIILVFAFLIFAVAFTFKKKMFIFSDNLFAAKRLRILALFLAYILLLSTVRAYVSTSSISYRINTLSLVLLLCIISLTIVFEKKLKLYESFINLIKNERNFLQQRLEALQPENKKRFIIELIVRYASILSTVAFGISITIFLILNHLSPKSIVIVFILALISTATLIIKKAVFEKETNACVFFLVTALIFGIFLSYAITPGTDVCWDGAIHYERILDLKAMFFDNEKTLYDEKMEYTHVYTFTSFFNDSEAFMNSITHDSDIINSASLSSVNLYQFLGYFPFALSMALSKFLSMSILPTIFLAKCANLLMYVFLIYFGIKKLKSGVYLFSTIALMPCAIFLATNFGYDSWVTAFTMYAYACFISELQRPNEKITAETVFLMLSAMFIGCGPKMVYFALIAPFIFMNKSKFDSKKSRIAYIFATAGTMLLVFISFALPFLLDVGANSDMRGGADVNSGEQFNFIIKNPLTYANLLVKFIFEYISLGNMNSNITSYSYLGTPHKILASVGILLILFAALTDRKHDIYPERKKLTLLTWISCFVQIALIATALYISFTPVAYHTVNGCQYRYLFPVMIPFFYFLGSTRIKNEIKQTHMNALIFGVLSTVLFMSIYDVYISPAISNL